MGLCVIDELVEKGAHPCAIKDVLLEMPACTLKKLAGNTMHYLCIGIFMACAFSCVAKKPGGIGAPIPEESDDDMDAPTLSMSQDTIPDFDCDSQLP